MTKEFDRATPVFTSDSSGLRAMNLEEGEKGGAGLGMFNAFIGACEDEIYYGEDKVVRTTTVEEHPNENGLGHDYFYSMKKFSNKVAQIDAETGEKDTFSSLFRRCVRTAIEMRNMGVVSSDIIALCTNNHLDSAVPYVAALFLGCRVASLDPSLSVADTTHLINLVQPRMVFVIPEAVGLVEGVLESTGVDSTVVVFGKTEQHVSFSQFLDEKDGEDDFVPVPVKNIKDTAVIFFSSGTTGYPKGICVNHYALMVQGAYLAKSEACSRVMLFSSLYWISASMFLTSLTLSGGAKLICKTFDPRKAWYNIEKYKITYMFLAPIQALEMCKCGRPEGIDTSSLLEVVTGGSALTKTQMAVFRDLLPGTHVNQAYGQTEVAGIITTFKTHNRKDVVLSYLRPHSCGRPVRSMFYKVVDPETEENLGFNEKGELRLKTECEMNGYYKMDSSDAWDADGWLKTGDIVYYDEDFCFYVVDRIKEMLKFRSWHVVPAVVESVVMQHPAVHIAVVVGLPHEEDGDHPTAVVVLSRGCNHVTPEEIEKFVEERVDDRQKLRGGVKIVDHLPLTPTGKVKRRLLRQMVLSGEI